MAQTNVKVYADEKIRAFLEVPLDFPNSETLAAIDDVDNGRNLSKTFHSVKDLMKDLNE